MESVTWKYSTLSAKKMFYGNCGPREGDGNNLWDIRGIVLIDFMPCSATVTAVPVRRCYSALTKQHNIRGLACLLDMSCYCTIMLAAYCLHHPSLAGHLALITIHHTAPSGFCRTSTYFAN
jgi:hypothetical protein